MTKGLQALDNIAYLEEYKWAGHPLGDEYAEEFRLITKELKILEIIKEKLVDVNWLKGCDELEDYNWVNHCELEQEEYNLLKEWLKDD